MKFGELLDCTPEEGFSDWLRATIAVYFIKRREIQLWEEKDKNKDQSYFLSRITREQLKFAEFPIGELEKAVEQGPGFGFGRCSQRTTRESVFLVKSRYGVSFHFH